MVDSVQSQRTANFQYIFHVTIHRQPDFLIRLAYFKMLGLKREWRMKLHNPVSVAHVGIESVSAEATGRCHPGPGTTEEGI
jgi:hypothetical protein